MPSGTPAETARALLAALAEDDAEAFDAAARACPGGPLEVLLASIDAEVRAAIETLRGADRFALLDVRRLVPHGGPGLWLATDWTRGALRGVRRAPFPAHEQWDALLGIHAARVEAPWMLGALVSRLAPDQGALARRMGLGTTRRFGARGEAILAHCVAAPRAD